MTETRRVTGLVAVSQREGGTHSQPANSLVALRLPTPRWSTNLPCFPDPQGLMGSVRAAVFYWLLVLATSGWLIAVVLTPVRAHRHLISRLAELDFRVARWPRQDSGRQLDGSRTGFDQSLV